MSPSVLADAFAHHTWATLTLLDACGELGPEQLATSVPGTYWSQVCTALTTLGLEPPGIDVWAFASQDGRIVITHPKT